MSDLARISAEEITAYSPETMIEWLQVRQAQRTAKLRAAVASLRAVKRETAQAHERLLAALGVQR